MAKNSFSSLSCQLNKLKNEGFSSALPQSLVTDVIRQLNISFRQRIFTPFLTLYAFIYQCLEDDSSCRRTVAHLLVFLSKTQKKILSPSTGSYCKARKRLPLKFFSTVATKLCEHMCTQIKPEWEWKHGVVKVVDGTGFVVADTKENLKRFQRHNSWNKKHLDSGFPMGRLLTVFSFATGGVLDLAISSYKGKGSGELSLIHQLWHCFKPGETLLGDCLFSSYSVVAAAMTRNIHVVGEFRPSRMRHLNKRNIDQIISLKKGIKPLSMPQKIYNTLPEIIAVRIIKVQCAPSGFRPKTKWLITTHLDKNVVPADDIASIYRQRWQAELNFRSIKTVLNLDFINAKSPDMVEKQIWTHMITYNLIRLRMVEAGIIGKKLPVFLSFRAAQQITIEVLNKNRPQHDDIFLIYLFVLAYPVGNRPGRYEPRVIKTRKKNFSFLREPRNIARQSLHKKWTGKAPG